MEVNKDELLTKMVRAIEKKNELELQFLIAKMEAEELIK
jgi:hypothetical protein